MHRSQRRSALFGWAGVSLWILALLAIAIPGVGYVQASGKQGFHLGSGPQHVTLPADQTYGIYVDDADNSGYSEQCSAVDARGQLVRMADPWWSLSGSETETLDIVFNTGSGDLMIDCSIPGEQVAVRPVPNLRAVVLGIALGGSLGVVGVILLIVWVIGRRSRRTNTSHGSTHEDSSSGTEPTFGRIPG